jgi:nucleoredoxin
MPWLALDFNERKKKEELSNKFSVSGIPKLVLLDGDSGSLICDDARTPIQNTDRKGEHFPWTSKGKDSSKNSSCLIL